MSIPLKKRDYIRQSSTTLNYDFVFQTKNVEGFKNAFEAISDKKVNPVQYAVINVGKNGGEITVNGPNDFCGYLSFEAKLLDEFESNVHEFHKWFPLTRVAGIFRVSENARFFRMFVEEGSNRLSFQLGPKKDGNLINIVLKAVPPGIRPFPKSISYMFEATVHSSTLRQMAVELHERTAPNTRKVKICFQPAIVEITAGRATTNSVGNGNLGQVTVETSWRQWKALAYACNTGNKAAMSLVTDPPSRVMIRFQLDHVGVLVYMFESDFESVPALPLLGHFRTLL